MNTLPAVIESAELVAQPPVLDAEYRELQVVEAPSRRGRRPRAVVLLAGMAALAIVNGVPLLWAVFVWSSRP